jgi:hypothetical protein
MREADSRLLIWYRASGAYRGARRPNGRNAVRIRLLGHAGCRYDAPPGMARALVEQSRIGRFSDGLTEDLKGDRHIEAWPPMAWT